MQPDLVSQRLGLRADARAAAEVALEKSDFATYRFKLTVPSFRSYPVDEGLPLGSVCDIKLQQLLPDRQLGPKLKSSCPNFGDKFAREYWTCLVPFKRFR